MADQIRQRLGQLGVTLEDRKTKRAYRMKVLRHEKSEFDLQVADDAEQVFETKTFIIKRGETLKFVNDDGELLHHAYLSAETFDFDTGDQQPGSQFDVVFSVAGDYTVLCGIHPKMKLLVRVN